MRFGQSRLQMHTEPVWLGVTCVSSICAPRSEASHMCVHVYTWQEPTPPLPRHTPPPRPAMHQVMQRVGGRDQNCQEGR